MTHVLIVEDNINVRITLEAVLQQSNLEITCCTQAIEALAAMKTHPADIVITDIVMPGMNGIELSQELKKLYPDIKILAISGGGHTTNADSSPLEQAKPFVDETLEKPFSTDELKAKLSIMGIKL